MGVARRTLGAFYRTAPSGPSSTIRVRRGHHVDNMPDYGFNGLNQTTALSNPNTRLLGAAMPARGIVVGGKFG